MKDLILVTCLYNYPDHIKPIFMHSALKSFDPSDIITYRFQSHDDKEYEVFSNGENDYYSKLYFYKIIKLREELQKIAHTTKHFLFMDALDTFIKGDKTKILNRYKEFGNDIVIGAERGLWPTNEYSKLYKIDGLDTPYLNSGTYIGRTDAILYALELLIKHGRSDVLEDQGAWSRLYLTGGVDMVVDTQRQLFFSTYESKDLLLLDGNGNFIGYKNPDFMIGHDNGGTTINTIKLANHYSGL